MRQTENHRANLKRRTQPRHERTPSRAAETNEEQAGRAGSEQRAQRRGRNAAFADVTTRLTARLLRRCCPPQELRWSTLPPREGFPMGEQLSLLSSRPPRGGCHQECARKQPVSSTSSRVGLLAHWKEHALTTREQIRLPQGERESIENYFLAAPFTPHDGALSPWKTIYKQRRQ